MNVLYWTLLCCLRLQGGHEEGSRPLDKQRSVESLARGEEETPSTMSNTEDESDSASDSEGEDAPTPALTVQRKKRHSPLLPPAQRETLDSLKPLPKPVPPPVPPKPKFALNPTAQQANLKVCVRLYFCLDITLLYF